MQKNIKFAIQIALFDTKSCPRKTVLQEQMIAQLKSFLSLVHVTPVFKRALYAKANIFMSPTMQLCAFQDYVCNIIFLRHIFLKVKR